MHLTCAPTSIHNELNKATIFQNFGYLTISLYPNELTFFRPIKGENRQIVIQKNNKKNKNKNRTTPLLSSTFPLYECI